MGDEDEVIVFGLGRSPYSFRVELALKLKAINYRFLEEDLSNKSPLLLIYNPLHKKVPVLVHNGNPIIESLVILEYIDENWKQGTSILPQDPHDRALARFWSKFIDDECMPVLLKLFNQQVEAEEEAKEMFGILEEEIQGKKFFGGDNLGLVDIVVISLTNWFKLVQEVVGLDLLSEENFPDLSKWSDEFANIPDVKESLPPREYMINVIRTRLPAR